MNLRGNEAATSYLTAEDLRLVALRWVHRLTENQEPNGERNMNESPALNALSFHRHLLYESLNRAMHEAHAAATATVNQRLEFNSVHGCGHSRSDYAAGDRFLCIRDAIRAINAYVEADKRDESAMTGSRGDYDGLYKQLRSISDYLRKRKAREAGADLSEVELEMLKHLNALIVAAANYLTERCPDAPRRGPRERGKGFGWHLIAPPDLGEDRIPV